MITIHVWKKNVGIKIFKFYFSKERSKILLKWSEVKQLNKFVYILLNHLNFKCQSYPMQINGASNIHVPNAILCVLCTAEIKLISFKLRRV